MLCTIVVRVGVRSGRCRSLMASNRETRGMTFIDHTARDVRYAARMLRTNPGFTLVAILSLALGIGANTAIFQLIEAVLLRSLPVPRPEEVTEVRLAGGHGGLGFSEKQES